LDDCALIDGASRWQILSQVPLALPSQISDLIFSFTLCRNEFNHGLAPAIDLDKTVPVAIVNEVVDGDIYKRGSLMVGSLPLCHSFAAFSSSIMCRR